MLECTPEEKAALIRLHAASAEVQGKDPGIRAEDVRLALNIIGRAKPKGWDSAAVAAKPAA
jgi:hypothetical protein